MSGGVTLSRRHRKPSCSRRNQVSLVRRLTCKYFQFRRRHVECYTTRAYFGVGLGVIENPGAAVGIVIMPPF